MKFLLLVSISFIYLLSYSSMANDNQKLNSQVDLLLKTNLKYIDKRSDAEKKYFSIHFEVYIINKTKKDLIIPSLGKRLTFSINYNSTNNQDFFKILFSNPTLYFSSSLEKGLLKANSYIKKKFKYSISEYDFNRYIKPNKYNLFQGWCELKKLKSNVVNIPIISGRNSGEDGASTSK